jgi:hypothetical protein
MSPTQMSNSPQSLGSMRGAWPRGMEAPARSYPLGLSGWEILGLAALGLGALAVIYLGPDIKRYIKISTM